MTNRQSAWNPLDKDGSMASMPSEHGHATPEPAERSAPHHTPSAERDPAPDVSTTSAVLEHGLLMVFGPDGDPLPPSAFCAAAAGQPDADVRVGNDVRAPAKRVAAVLEAQTGGRLASGEADATAWIEAMLGLGSQPAMTAPAELHAEDASEPTYTSDGPCDEHTTAGAEPPVEAGRVGSSVPETLVLGPDGVLDLGCLAQPGEVERARVRSLMVAGLPKAAMLSAGSNDGCGSWRLTPAELPGLALFAIPEQLVDFDLTLTFVTAEGKLSRDLRIEVERGVEEEAEGASRAPRADAVEPEAASPATAGPPRVDDALGRADAAMVIVAGVPAGTVLSAGSDNGDGSWSVPVDGAQEVAVALPVGQVQALRLVLTAVAVGGLDGRLVSRSREIVLAPGEPISLSVLDDAGPDRSPQMFALELADVALGAGEAGKIDAVVIGGLPEGASLSQGTYDDAIASWILRPDQLEGLTVGPVEAQRLALKVTAVTMDRAAGKSRARTREVSLDLDARAEPAGFPAS